MFRVPSPISDATDDFNTAPARPAAEDPGDGTPGESQAPPRTIPPGWEREPAWMVSQTEASMDSYPRGSGFYFPKPTQEVLQVGDSVPPAWSSQEHYTGRAIPGRPPSQIVPDSYSGGIFAGGRSESFETDGSITPTQSSTNSVQSALPSFFKPHLGLDYAHVSYSADTTIRMPRAQVTASSSLGSDTSSMRTPLAPVRTPSSRANVPGISSSRETGRTATERLQKLNQHKGSRSARHAETDRHTTSFGGFAQPPTRQGPSGSNTARNKGPANANASAPTSSTHKHFGPTPMDISNRFVPQTINGLNDNQRLTGFYASHQLMDICSVSKGNQPDGAGRVPPPAGNTRPTAERNQPGARETQPDTKYRYKGAVDYEWTEDELEEARFNESFADLIYYADLTTAGLNQQTWIGPWTSIAGLRAGLRTYLDTLPKFRLENGKEAKPRDLLQHLINGPYFNGWGLAWMDFKWPHSHGVDTVCKIVKEKNPEVLAHLGEYVDVWFVLYTGVMNLSQWRDVSIKELRARSPFSLDGAFTTLDDANSRMCALIKSDDAGSKIAIHKTEDDRMFGESWVSDKSLVKFARVEKKRRDFK